MSVETDGTNRAGSLSSSALFEVTVEQQLVEHVKARETGAFEVVVGQVRRAFFLRAGRIVGTSSNLKSETPERVAQKLGITDPEILLDQIAATRFANACRAEDAEVIWHADRTLSREQPYDTGHILWLALENLLDRTMVKLRVDAIGQGNPCYAIEGRDFLDLVPSEFRQWIEDIDGVRTVDEACEFGPVEPLVCHRAVYLGALLGVLSLSEQAAIGVTLTSVTDVKEGDTFLPFGSISAGGTTGAESSAAEEPAEIELNEPEEQPEQDPKLKPLFDEIKRVRAAENMFEVLGVAWDIGVDGYRDAYFRIARQLHPDHLETDNPEHIKAASEVFDRVRDAWETLKDEKQRTEYIERIVHGKKTENEIAMEKVRDILDAEAVFRRGVASLNAGQLVKAHAAFEEASRLVPEESEFKMYLGFTTYKTLINRDEEAAAEGAQMIKNAMGQGAKADVGNVLLGRIFRERGDEQRAAKSFLKAFKANPTNLDAQRELERIKRQRDQRGQEQEKKEGFFGRLFGRKKEE